MEDIVRCIAIDDEPLALSIIAEFCRRIGGIELSTYTSPREGLDHILSDRPDIAFLDIEMDDISGIDIASRLPDSTCFIFTTAYPDYAIDGFELDAVDYLHKPFSYARFQTAFARARRRIGSRAAVTPRVERSILVKEEYNNVSIPLADITFIEAMEGYVKIHRSCGTCTLSRMILKNIGIQLPDTEFISIHRSYIIPKGKVKSFNRREVELTDGTTLPIGRQYAADVAAQLSATD